MKNNSMKTPFKKRLKMILAETVTQIANYAIILILSLLVGAVVIYLTGKDPVAAYQALWKGAFGNWYKVTDTLDRSTVLIFSGLAAAVAFRTSIFNLGLEGQLYIGAFTAALVGFTVKGLPAGVHIPLCLLAGALAGGIWSLPPIIFKLKWNVPVMVPTLMLNYIGILFTSYLIAFPFKDPTAPMAGTPVLEATARLPKLIRGHTLNIGFPLALAAVFLIYWFMFRTKLGYELRMVGYNPDFAASTGLPVKRSSFLAMMISGMLVGLGGSIVIMGFFGRFMGGFSVGYGWDGMMISLLAQNHPLGVLPASLFYAALANGALTMQSTTGVPQTVVVMVKGTIMFFVTVQIFSSAIRRRFQKWTSTSAE